MRACPNEECLCALDEKFPERFCGTCLAFVADGEMTEQDERVLRAHRNLHIAFFWGYFVILLVALFGAVLQVVTLANCDSASDRAVALILLTFYIYVVEWIRFWMRLRRKFREFIEHQLER